MKNNKMLGWIGTGIFLIFTAMAVLQYPGYDFEKQFLSELGIGNASANWFNAGLLLSGACFAAFFLGAQHGKKASGTVGLLSSLALISVGIFPLSQPVLHEIATGMFFVFAGLAILLFSLEEWKQKKALAMLGFLAVLSDAFLLLFQEPVSQKIAAGFFLAWITAVSLQN